MESILPSEIARLVYGYLEEDGCKMAAKAFLETSPHLKECVNIVSKGRKFTTKFNGLDLVELLELICELSCYVRSVECEMKAKDFTLAEVLRQIFVILRLVNDGKESNKPLYLRFTVPSSPKKGRKTKAAEPLISRLKPSSCTKSPTLASSPSLEGSPDSPEDDDPNEILFQCLLENKALHKKLADNINQAVATKCDSQPLDKILEEKIVETIINTTEQDPVFQEMLDELVGPIDNSAKGEEQKGEDRFSVSPQPSLSTSTYNNSIEGSTNYSCNLQKTPNETPRVTSVNNFPGFPPPIQSPSTSSMMIAPDQMTLAQQPAVLPTTVHQAYQISAVQSSTAVQTLQYQPAFPAAKAAYSGPIVACTLPSPSNNVLNTVQQYSCSSSVIPVQQLQRSQPVLGSLSPVKPALPTSTPAVATIYRTVFPRPAVSSIKIFTPNPPAAPTLDAASKVSSSSASNLEELLRQPIPPPKSNVKKLLPSKGPKPQPTAPFTRSAVNPLRAGGVRTRGGKRENLKTYSATKRAKVLPSLSSLSKIEEKPESSSAQVYDIPEPMYSIVVTPISRTASSNSQDGSAKLLGAAPSVIATSGAATLHAFNSTASEYIKTAVPSIIVSQAKSPPVTATDSMPGDHREKQTSTVNVVDTSPVKLALPVISCADAPVSEPATSVASSLASSLLTNLNTEALTTSTQAHSTLTTTTAIKSTVDATPQQGSEPKKNLRKRLSMSTPRKGPHVRTLEFATPHKSTNQPKKSLTSPKIKTAVIVPFEKRRLENVKSDLFKSPLEKKKKSWDSDLRVVFTADDDIPTSVGLKRKEPPSLKPSPATVSPSPAAPETCEVNEAETPEEIYQTEEEIVCRIQKDVLDVIGEENLCDLSGNSFGTNKSPSISNRVPTDVSSPSKSPCTPSVLEIGDIGIPASTIKRLYPKHEIHRDETSTTLDSPAKTTNTPPKRLVDSVCSKLFSSPSKEYGSSPVRSLPSTPNSASLESTLIRECARIEAIERPFKDIALSIGQGRTTIPTSENSAGASTLLPPPKGTTVLKTPAKLGSSMSIEMTPVSKIIHEQTRECILLTPTIPPTPDTDQMKIAENPQDSTPPDALKLSGPIDSPDETLSTSKKPTKTPTKTPSKTPQVRLRAKAKTKENANKKPPGKNKAKKYSKLIEECFERAKGAVYGEDGKEFDEGEEPDEYGGEVNPPPAQPLQPPPPTNKKKPTVRKKSPKTPAKSVKKTGKNAKTSGEVNSVFEKLLNIHETANAASESDRDEEKVEHPKKVVKRGRKPKKCATVAPEVKPADKSDVENPSDSEVLKAAEKNPVVNMDDVAVARGIESPSPPNSSRPNLDSFEFKFVLAEDNGGQLEPCIRASHFLDLFELPRDSVAASNLIKPRAKVSSDSGHQASSQVSQPDDRRKRPRRSDSDSDSLSKNKRSRLSGSQYDDGRRHHRAGYDHDSHMSDIRRKRRFALKTSFLQEQRSRRYSPGRAFAPKMRHRHRNRFPLAHKTKHRSKDRSTHRSLDRGKSRSRDRSVARSKPQSRDHSSDRSKPRSRDSSKHRSRDHSNPRSRDRSKHGSRDRSSDRSNNRSSAHRPFSSRRSATGKFTRDKKSVPEKRLHDLEDNKVIGGSPSFANISTAKTPAVPSLQQRQTPRYRVEHELEEGELSDTSRSTVLSFCKKIDITSKSFPARLSSPVDDESRQALLQQVDLDKFLTLVHSRDKK